MSEKPEKFLFNRHNFDSGRLGEDDLYPERKQKQQEPEQEDLPPPPPTFSEEELEAAKKQAADEAYQKGMADGQKAEQEKQDQHIASLLTQIDEKLPNLTAAAQENKKIFEQSAHQLVHIILTKLLPSVISDKAESTIIDSINHILAGGQNLDNININVHPDHENAIQQHISTLSNADEITLTSSDTIPIGNCDITWKNGGAKLDLQTIQDTINNILQENTPQTEEKPENNPPSGEIEDSPPPPECDKLPKDDSETPSD